MNERVGIELENEERRLLELLTSCRSTSAELAESSRVVLLADQDRTVREICEEIGVSPKKIRVLCQLYQKFGLAGIESRLPVSRAQKKIAFGEPGSEVKMTDSMDVVDGSPAAEWVEEIIRIRGADQVRCIVDVGANVGRVSMVLCSYFPKADVYCFEPCVESYQELVRNFSGARSVSCFKLALGKSIGEAILHTYTNNLCNTMSSGLQEDWLVSTGSEVVGVTTLDYIANQCGVDKIDLLKVDVEGCELDVIYGAHELLINRKVTFIYAEVGFNEAQRHQYFSDLHEHLTGLDYRLCGFYESYKVGNMGEYLCFCNALYMIEL